MANSDPHEVPALRQLMQRFIHERLQTKLDKLDPDEHNKRQQLEDAHHWDNWLTDAARRVTQIQLATHTLKPIHPDARGSSLHTGDVRQDHPGLVGTFNLDGPRADDVVGNAAALDVFKFLSLEHNGCSLLQRILADDAGMKSALSDDVEQAQAWRDAFARITAGQQVPASHTLAKQLYFPLPEGDYHLLAPLFPTSLTHQVHRTLREHRFGDAAKAARIAHRDKTSWHEGYHEYPQLAIQKFGGTKPQNISQLNSERYGENWLLASLPPSWQTLDVRPPINVDSVFGTWFGRRRVVREAVKELQQFLARPHHNNLAIRRKRTRLLGLICDEAHQYAAQLHELPAGWSSAENCKRLDRDEALWLDPMRVHIDEDFRKDHLWWDWPVTVSKRFANWLNASVDNEVLKLSEVEARQWADDLHQELRMFKEILDDDRA